MATRAIPNINSKVLMVMAALLVILILTILLYTSTCKYEKFEDGAVKASEGEGDEEKDEGADAEGDLSTREVELFNEIMSSKITAAHLEKLISAGQITEKMVEKFLNKLDKDSGAASAATTTVEGFASNDQYSSF